MMRVTVTDANGKALYLFETPEESDLVMPEDAGVVLAVRGLLSDALDYLDEVTGRGGKK